MKWSRFYKDVLVTIGIFSFFECSNFMLISVCWIKNFWFLVMNVSLWSILRTKNKNFFVGKFISENLHTLTSRWNLFLLFSMIRDSLSHYCMITLLMCWRHLIYTCKITVKTNYSFSTEIVQKYTEFEWNHKA